MLFRSGTSGRLSWISRSACADESQETRVKSLFRDVESVSVFVYVCVCVCVCVYNAHSKCLEQFRGTCSIQLKRKFILHFASQLAPTKPFLV